MIFDFKLLNINYYTLTTIGIAAIGQLHRKNFQKIPFMDSNFSGGGYGVT